MHRNWNHQLTIGRCYLAGRSTLSEDKQNAYDAIFNCVKTRKSHVILNRNISQDDLKTLFAIIRNDAPGLFWVDNKYTVESQKDIIILKPNYVYDEAKIIFYKRKLEQNLKNLHSTLSNCVSELEVEYKVHDYLTSNVSYVDSGKIEEHNIIGSMLYNEGVCEGISASFNFIMNSFGIDCMTVFGTTNDGESHSWNIIELDGEHYHVDITNDLSGIHTFLNISDDLMKKDRTWNTEIKCSSMDLNYHCVNKTVFRNDIRLLLHLRRNFQRSVPNLEFRVEPDRGLEHIEKIIIKSLSKNIGRNKICVRTVSLGTYSVSITLGDE